MKRWAGEANHPALRAGCALRHGSQTTGRPSLNFSRFVACKIWRVCGVSPLRGRAHRLPRRKPLRGLLVPMATIVELLQTALH